MRKVIFLLLISLSITLPLYSAQVEESLNCEYYFKSRAFNLSIDSSVLWETCNKIDLGLKTGLGASLAHYKKSFSDAYVYGPSFLVNLCFAYKIQNSFILQTSAGVAAIYATFPNVLWLNLEEEAKYYFNKNIAISLGAKFLFLQNIEGGLNAKILYKF